MLCIYSIIFILISPALLLVM